MFWSPGKELKTAWKQRELILLGIPGVIILLIFYYFPMFGLIIAFKDFLPAKGFWGSDWIGFKNFEFFFTSDIAARVTRNTVFMNIAFITFGQITALITSLALFELSKRVTKFYQTALFIPYFTSWVVVGFLLYGFLNKDLGLVNQLRTEFGFEAKVWYLEPEYWPSILIIANIWKELGFRSLIYYTGLMGLDSALYEAAAIDGASKTKQIMKISIPLLFPLIALLTMTQIGQIMRADFGLFYFLPQNSGPLYAVTDVIDTFVFRSIRVTGDFGMGAAAGLYQSAVGLFIVLLSNWSLRRLSPDNAVF
jgi:putative aldouronate transport system permease protein